MLFKIALKKLNSILIIDDEEAIIDFLGYYLKKEGFIVRTICDSQLALRYLENNIPSLIISDWMIPGLSGVGILWKLKRDDRFKKIPFIMMTCKNKKEDIDLAFDLGADDYIVKPFKMMDLKKKIEEHLKKSEGNF